MADFSYADIAIADGDAAQATITREDDNISIQAVYSDIDQEIDIVAQQSHDGTNWDAITDEKGEVFKLICLKQGIKPKSSGNVMRTLAGVFAKYIRVKLMVKKATIGTVTITGQA